MSHSSLYLSQKLETAGVWQAEVKRSGLDFIERNLPKLEQPFLIGDDLDQFKKELKRRDSKIALLQTKLKKTEESLNELRSKSSQLQYNLSFYKLKLQEECLKNNSYEQEMRVFSKAIDNYLLRLKSLRSHKQQLIDSSVEEINPQTSVDLSSQVIEKLNRLESHIGRLENTIGSLKEQPQKIRQELYQSVNATIQFSKREHDSEIDALRRQMMVMMTEYEKKLSESKSEHAFEMKKLLEQRTYSNGLLQCSEREKIVLLNDVYQIARIEQNLDFEKMSKGDITLLCLKLFGKLKDLEDAKRELTQTVEGLQTEKKQEYKKLLKSVRDLERSPKKKIGGLKRMESMPIQ